MKYILTIACLQIPNESNNEFKYYNFKDKTNNKIGINQLINPTEIIYLN